MAHHFTIDLAKKLAQKFNIAGPEIEKVINEFCEDQKASIWTIEEVIDYVGTGLNLPANRKIAAEAMELATGGFFKANGKINWNPLETAFESVLKNTFKAFEVTEKDNQFIITGIAIDPNREPNPDDIKIYTSGEAVQEALKALWCLSDKFELTWNGQKISDPFEDNAFSMIEKDEGSSFRM